MLKPDGTKYTYSDFIHGVKPYTFNVQRSTCEVVDTNTGERVEADCVTLEGVFVIIVYEVGLSGGSVKTCYNLGHVATGAAVVMGAWKRLSDAVRHSKYFIDHLGSEYSTFRSGSPRFIREQFTAPCRQIQLQALANTQDVDMEQIYIPV